MQFLFLFLAPLFFGCQKEVPVDHWQTPSILFLTQEDKKLTQATNQERFTINNYVSFTQDGNPLSDIQVTGKSICGNETEKEEFQKTFAQIPFQFKSIVSPKIFLKEPSTACSFEIILRNLNGSTKTFQFSKIISLGDHLSELNITQLIEFSDFQTTVIPTGSPSGRAELYCEAFQTELVTGQSGTTTLHDLAMNHTQTKKGIAIQSYYPHQNCRIIARTSKRTLWSHIVRLKFQKLRPTLKVQRGSKPFTLLSYSMKFSNPYSISLSFALKKQDFIFPAICQGHCQGVKIPPHNNSFQGEVQFSNLSRVYKGADLYIIYLRPGESFEAQVQVKGRSNFMSGSQIVPYFDIKSVGAYDLEYNYRSLQEIEAHPPKIIDKFFETYGL